MSESVSLRFSINHEHDLSNNVVRSKMTKHINAFDTIIKFTEHRSEGLIDAHIIHDKTVIVWKKSHTIRNQQHTMVTITKGLSDVSKK
jgi:hypothetical protein